MKGRGHIWQRQELVNSILRRKSFGHRFHPYPPSPLTILSVSLCKYFPSSSLYIIQLSPLYPLEIPPPSLLQDGLFPSPSPDSPSSSPTLRKLTSHVLKTQINFGRSACFPLHFDSHPSVDHRTVTCWEEERAKEIERKRERERQKERERERERERLFGM